MNLIYDKLKKNLMQCTHTGKHIPTYAIQNCMRTSVGLCVRVCVRVCVRLRTIIKGLLFNFLNEILPYESLHLFASSLLLHFVNKALIALTTIIC